MLEAGLLRGWPEAERHNTGQSVPCCSTARIFRGQTSLSGALTECVNVAKLPSRPDCYPWLCNITSETPMLYAYLFCHKYRKYGVRACCI